MRAVWVPLTGALAVAVTMMALLPSSTEAQPQSVTVSLAAQNSSGMAGTAVLTPDGAGTKVVLTLTNAPGPHPAHIHSGACPNVGAVVFPLTTVTNGRSETTVAASIATILASPHAINVHKSPQESQIYTSCGNVTAGAAAASGPAAAPKPAAAAPAAQPSPAAKPAASPAAAPAQAPRPAASPAALPRTGEADPTAGTWVAVVAGFALLGGGIVLLARRRRSA